MSVSGAVVVALLLLLVIDTSENHGCSMALTMSSQQHESWRQQATPPSPPTLSNAFVAVKQLSVAEEGTSATQTVYQNGEKGKRRVDSQTHNGWGSQVLIANQSNLHNSTVAFVLFVDGKKTCAQYKMYLPLPFPPPQAVSGAAFSRLGEFHGHPRNVFRAPINRYVGQYYFSPDTTGIEGRLHSEVFNNQACAISVEGYLDNNTAPMDSVFDLPDDCVTYPTPTIHNSFQATVLEQFKDVSSIVGSTRGLNFAYAGETHHSVFAKVHKALAGKSWYKRFDEGASAREETAEYQLYPGKGKAVDNRKYATSVRNQGDCGGCWAFSSVAATEVVLNKAHNRTIFNTPSLRDASAWLSPQNVIDCAHNSSAWLAPRGCLGGNPAVALAHIVEFGINTESDYVFDSVTGTKCRQAKATSITPLIGVHYIPPPPTTASGHSNTAALMAAVSRHGAVVSIINVIDSMLFFDGHGVYNDPACTPGLAHGITIVGYGTTTTPVEESAQGAQAGADYWIVKNSWGAAWGDAGYIKIARGVNRCGIENFGFVPVASVV